MVLEKRPEDKRQKRHVYGFLCSDGLRLVIKFLGRQLRVPDYCVAEHLLEFAVAHVGPMLQDKKFRKELEEHLITAHLLQAESLPNAYDERMTKKARREQLLHIQREKKIRWLVDVAEQDGMSLRQLIAIIRKGLPRAKRT